jgi:hypothetical protein
MGRFYLGLTITLCGYAWASAGLWAALGLFALMGFLAFIVALIDDALNVIGRAFHPRTQIFINEHPDPTRPDNERNELPVITTRYRRKQ